MFPDICRTCFKEFQGSSEIVPLFEPYKNIWYYRLINTTFNLTLTQNDQLGSSICRTCALQVLKSYKFRLKYKETEEKLQKMLEQSQDAEGSGCIVQSPSDSSEQIKRLLHSNVASDVNARKSNGNVRHSTKVETKNVKSEQTDVSSWSEPAIVIHDDDSGDEFIVPTITEVNVEINVDQTDFKLDAGPEPDLGLYLTEKQTEICGFDPLDEDNSNDSLLVPMDMKRSPRKTYTGDLNKKWTCRICSESFRTRDLLREHNHIHMAMKQNSKLLAKSEPSLEPKVKKVKPSSIVKKEKELKW
ncbi:hypothetical protein Bhyg_05666, partial [Pseudolycoriella hygida]